ncbi:hypothetical protein MAPG_09004 [Magnaporthiopsis poae ATCC 64411]|uniref:Uncharacterized protein n=1 Tax=Magnaporthiopsis poae (strain ATCC 64411 / 73-15) TaxID=644358 RepID=A0A0C4E8T5_MAGP6|nr:hypothetical protein MAPG_09004 [Magnaporthiopsis poae ATCC 64411]
MCADPAAHMPAVTRVLAGFEAQSRADVDGWVEKGARALLKEDAGDREAARRLLTHFSHARAAQALELGKTIADGLDKYVKLTGAWRDPVGSSINDAGEGAETVNCLVGYDPDKPAWKQSVNPAGRRRRGFAQAPLMA